MSSIRMLAAAVAATLLCSAGGPPRAGEAPAGKLDPAVEKTCLEFARNIEATVNAGNPAPLNKAVDIKSMVDLALKGLDVAPDLMTGFRTGAKSFQLGTVVVTQSIQNGGSYKFLRLRVVDGQPRAQFRLLQSSEGGLNYHELILAVPAAGAPSVPDVYIYLSAECMSETLRRAMLPAVAEQNKGVIAKLTGQQNDFIKSLAKIQAMQALVKQGKHAEALAALKGLPASLQTDKNILITRVGIAANVDEGEYVAAMDAMRKALPNDACLDIMSLDALFLRKKYAEAIQAADRLEQLVGGDPYLNVVRGSVYYAQKQLDKGRECVQKALDAEPKLIQAHFTMITICIDQKDYAAVAKTLSFLENDMGVELNDLTQVPEYADFVKSEQYKTWQAGRKKLPAKPVPGKKAEN
jgi:tetratricopeptide (TPR) repeat protein